MTVGEPAEFRVDVPDAALADLHERLGRTRLPVATPSPRPWGAGVDLGVLGSLLDHWRDGFDWRAAEARLNEVPQFRVAIDGGLVHFVHLRGTGERRVPIVLTHGWPYSFVEMLPLAHLLAASTDPGFDVVVPSLPGYLFSEPMPEPFTSTSVASRWHRLMTEVLGYARYATYGEDVGTWVSDRLAATYPDAVLGLFATHAAFPPEERRADLSDTETAFVAWLGEKWEGETGYSAQQTTRPDTLAVGLTDSPAGLAAWLVEKYHAWSGADDLATYWSVDEVLTTVSLYWFTSCIGTSFRAYVDDDHETPTPLVEVPVGVAVQHGERGFPRSYAARTYTDIRLWDPLPRGGHFTAKQTPELVADRLVAFVRSL